MELQDILFSFRKNWKTAVAVAAVFGLIGAVAYFYLPKTYKATGTFYVTRKVDDSRAYFSYEGHYAQQTAISHTRTIMGLFESVDVIKKALENIGWGVTDWDIILMKKNIKVKNVAPQIVTLEIKGQSKIEVRSVWEEVSSISLSELALASENGDQNLQIHKPEWSPVVRETYRNLYINVMVGVFLGLFVAFFVCTTKEYL